MKTDPRMAPVVGIAIALLAAGTLIAAALVGDTVDPYAIPDDIIDAKPPAVQEAPPMVAPGGNINGEVAIGEPQVRGKVLTAEEPDTIVVAIAPEDDTATASDPRDEDPGEPKEEDPGDDEPKEPPGDGGGRPPGGTLEPPEEPPVARPDPDLAGTIPPGHAKHDGPGGPPGHARNDDVCDGPPGHAKHDDECLASVGVDSDSEDEDAVESNETEKKYAKKDDEGDPEAGSDEADDDEDPEGRPGLGRGNGRGAAGHA